MDSIKRSTYHTINCYKLLDLYDRGALPLYSNESNIESSRKRIKYICEKSLSVSLERFGFLSLCLPSFNSPVLYTLQPNSLPHSYEYNNNTNHIYNQYNLNDFNLPYQFNSLYYPYQFNSYWKKQFIQTMKSNIQQKLNSNINYSLPPNKLIESHYDSLNLFEPSPFHLSNVITSSSSCKSFCKPYCKCSNLKLNPSISSNSSYILSDCPTPEINMIEKNDHIYDSKLNHPNLYSIQNHPIYNEDSFNDSQINPLNLNHIYNSTLPQHNISFYNPLSLNQNDPLIDTNISIHQHQEIHSSISLDKLSNHSIHMIGFQNKEEDNQNKEEDNQNKEENNQNKEEDNQNKEENNQNKNEDNENKNEDNKIKDIIKNIHEDKYINKNTNENKNNINHLNIQNNQYINNMDNINENICLIKEIWSFYGIYPHIYDYTNTGQYNDIKILLRKKNNKEIISTSSILVNNILGQNDYIKLSCKSKNKNPSSLDEIHNIFSIISNRIGHTLNLNTKQMLWRHRSLLQQRGIGLLKLMNSTDILLNVNKVPQAITDLLISWPTPTIENTLELLSPVSQTRYVRLFAIEALKLVSDLNICRYLPQLIQAIRYDMNGSHSYLLDLLIQRSLYSPLIASKLHWGLLCESEDTEGGHIFIRGHQKLIDKLYESYNCNNHLNGWKIIEYQKKLIRQFRYISSQLRERRDRADQKTQRLRTLLNEYKNMASPLNQDWTTIYNIDESKSIKQKNVSNRYTSHDHTNLLNLNIPIPLPVEPHHLLIGIIPEESFVVRSSQYPIVFACRVLVPKNNAMSSFNEKHQTFSGITYSSYNTISTFYYKKIMSYWGQSKEEIIKSGEFEERIQKYLFKTGDDLRQDQLVTQMIGIIHDILINYGCDFYLTLYHVISLSRHDGLIEFVDHSGSLSSVKKTFNNLRQYFISFYPNNTEKYPLPPEILDRFVKSCSAFSVITFLLGVGDRHLDNLMVTEDGRLFHVDFGFILGEDPKPFPPPMKLCNEIIEALGGLGSQGYTEFQLRCCQCFRCLRRHSNLLLDTLLLMANSGIRSLRTDPFTVISRVQEKFQLETTEQEAEAYLLDIVAVSANALFPAVVDKFHQWTVYWK